MSGEIDAFVCAWDALETAHPFGIDRFTPFFMDFGVPIELCEYVDRFLYLDMMVPWHVDVRRLKVERRQSSTVSWVYVQIISPSALAVAFQSTPAAPFERIMTMEATPRALIEALVLYHGASFPPRMRCTWQKPSRHRMA